MHLKYVSGRRAFPVPNSPYSTHLHFVSLTPLCPSVMRTENVAEGAQTGSFQNVGGVKCIQYINFSKV